MAQFCVINYIFPQGVCVYDNQTQTALFEVRLKNCDDITGYPESCNDLFNQQACNIDNGYSQPVCQVTSTDSKYLYFQFSFFVPDSEKFKGWKRTVIQADWYLNVELLDGCCEVIEGFNIYPEIILANTFLIGDFYYQTIKIDITNLPDCFSFHFFTNDGKNAYTEPFIKDCCNGVVKLEGVYSNTDCSNHYYPAPTTLDTGDSFAFRNIVYFNSEAILQSYDIEAKTNRNVVLSKMSTEKINIKTESVPEYVAKQIKTILNAKSILVTGGKFVDAEFDFTGSLQRTLEKTHLWELDITLSRIDCQMNLKC